MAFDAFLKFESKIIKDDLKGESLDRAYAGWVEIASFSFGYENQLNLGSASGGVGAGKATFKEFVVEKRVDSITPVLIKALCTSQHFDTVHLHLRKAGAASKLGSEAFIQIQMKVVAVKDVEISGGGGDDLPLEKVIFQYGAIQFGYRPQDQTGKIGAEKTAIWSRITNTSTLDVS